MTETATLAGGCFWCTEAVFRRLKGLISVVSGYSGGHVENPTAEEVYTETTGHAESIQIEFDPEIISYDKLLEIFFHLHDPTTPNQQGADIGPEYRSAIFYHTEGQKRIAEMVKRKIEEEKVYPDPIVTEITPFKDFYKADESHQNFYEKNTRPMYCRLIIDPKISKLMQDYKEAVV